MGVIFIVLGLVGLGLAGLIFGASVSALQEQIALSFLTGSLVLFGFAAVLFELARIARSIERLVELEEKQAGTTQRTGK